jgi:predicted acylesterase/phospholipase RssA
MKMLQVLVFGWLLLVMLSSCGIIPAYISKNEAHDVTELNVPRASYKDWSKAYETSDVFVGVALSGGGSRSANFSAAVLLELEKLGFLKHLTAISSVSGGSLTAAYYGLFREAENWSWEDFRERLRTDFFARFLLKLITPWNFLLSLFTDYDRSDMMAEVFDDTLFKGKQYADLGGSGPKIFLNATDLLGQNNRYSHTFGKVVRHLQKDESTPLPYQPFVFTEEEFQHLQSRLDTFPVSQAVMASGAFPAVFNNVTLRNYIPQVEFGHDDLKDPKSLALKWRDGGDAISAHLRSYLPQKIENSLQSYTGKEHLPPEIQDGMLYALNLSMYAGDLPVDKVGVRADGLDEIKLRKQTKDLLQSSKHTQKLGVDSYETLLLYRLLLEDAYPDELGKMRKTYVHLFDGGVSDNLGLDTLLWAARNFYDKAPKGRKARGCFIFVVDAHLSTLSRHYSYQPDTRGLPDYVFDHNAMTAIDVLFADQRSRAMSRGQSLKDPDGRDYSSIKRFDLPQLNSRSKVKDSFDCVVWDINFDVLARPGEINQYLSEPDDDDDHCNKDPFDCMWRAGWLLEQLYATSVQIETHYKLTGPTNCSVKFIQDVLFRVAEVAVRGDELSLEKARDWFQKHKLALNLPPIPPIEKLSREERYRYSRSLLYEPLKYGPLKVIATHDKAVCSP